MRRSPIPLVRPSVLALALLCCPARRLRRLARQGRGRDGCPERTFESAGGAAVEHPGRLTWQDNSDDETHFVLALRDGRTGEFIEIPFAIPPDTTSVLITGLDPYTRYTWLVRARNAFGTSGPSNPATFITYTDDYGCTVSDTELCLLSGRFQVRLRFIDPRFDDGEKTAIVVPSTDQTGLFWFFSPGNIELIVKMLDGRGFNRHFWVFYGGVSDLEYRLEVLDTVTGRSAEYYNRPGEICGQANIQAFTDETLGDKIVPRDPSIDVAELGIEALPSPFPAPDLGPQAVASRAGDREGSCVPDDRGLCLLGDRLRVEVGWKNPHDGGSEGFGWAVFGGDRSGYFWFFDASNTELVVKALDGSRLNGHLWFFFGALTDLEYWLAVTDTVTGDRQIYYNPPGKICGQADIEAFPSAPRE